MISPRLILYGLGAAAVAALLWWLIHAWNAGQHALRELPKLQQQLDAERKTATLLMAETERMATADSEARTVLSVRLDSVDSSLAALAKSSTAQNVVYHYETINGQQCAVALLGDDFVRVYNAAADAASAPAQPADGSDATLRLAVPPP